MEKFKFNLENRFSELHHDSPSDRKAIYNFYKERIEPVFSTHSMLRTEENKYSQSIIHLCYDCNIELWNELYELMIVVANHCQMNLNWSEIKHLLKFTFISTPPRGNLQPHTAHHLRALSAFNIPLIGKTEIDFYDDTDGTLQHIKRHEYTNPNILNVFQPHGVINNTDEERLILKTHLLAIPMEMAKASYMAESPLSLFDFTVPWVSRNTTGAFDHIKESDMNL